MKFVLPEPKFKTTQEMVRAQNASAAEREDRNCMTFWFPRIEAAGLPVPKTRLLTMPEAAQVDAWTRIDNPREMPEPVAWNAFVEGAKHAADEIGFPLFLRSGHTSGKHEWDRTCNVRDRDKLGAHIFGIIYFSELCGMFGELPWRTWALREMLPTKPVGRCTGYDNMPICREFRFFVEDGEVKCWHPYWPPVPLLDGRPEFTDWFRYADFADPGDDLPALKDIASRAGAACGGAWSVDLLETERGWYLTDMAEARSSFHWEGCPSVTARD